MSLVPRVRRSAGALLVVLVLGLVAACQGGGDTPSASGTAGGSSTGTSAGGTASPSASSTGTAPVVRPTRTPAIRHVFVVNLENKSFETTFGADSPAPYLSRTLTAKGALLTQFHGIAHYSLSNYLAQISGQGPNGATQADCGTFSRFVSTGTVAPQQALGRGCVFPSSVRTVANQLEDRGLTWRGYMQDMGTSCRHPVLDGPDTMHTARVGDQYAVRHDPFVYFQAISAASCRRNVVDLDRLPADLAVRSRTRNLTYITPDLCSDGHDAPCVDGRPGGLVSADLWLRTWVPKILASPAYRADGALVITFDEADPRKPGGSDACCGETSMPNAPKPGISGPGGGRIGAVVLSRFVKPGTRSDEPYNQFSLLRTVEAVFRLPYLGYAARVNGFGSDVWTS